MSRCAFRSAHDCIRCLGRLSVAAYLLVMLTRSLGMAKMLYDAMRTVDVLESLPEVDRNRIGAVGHSLGTKETLYLAALDERVKVAVASEGGIGFRSTNWDAPWYLGEAIRDEQFPLNHHQLLALIAPRPILILGGESGHRDARLLPHRIEGHLIHIHHEGLGTLAL